jgi:hypothetical protein
MQAEALEDLVIRWFSGLGNKTAGGRFLGLGLKTWLEFRRELEGARGHQILLSQDGPLCPWG